MVVYSQTLAVTNVGTRLDRVSAPGIETRDFLRVEVQGTVGVRLYLRGDATGASVGLNPALGGATYGDSHESHERSDEIFLQADGAGPVNVSVYASRNEERRNR